MGDAPSLGDFLNKMDNTVAQGGKIPADAQGLYDYGENVAKWGLLSSDSGFGWLWDLLETLSKIAGNISGLIGLM